ncbi:GNAT family N-acetyltransferase [Nocardioides marmoriginsengisoli]|uniref:GNAT family N-acetyltransferase n=1 Tax=Nocardioides marmoriginsengisoli TaxID=661483 RepID=A0A3N0CC71_9ACTN|nr:GNAT family N-acetyltransferase [Nocardioides marmoriginsengisoli]
MTPADHAAVLSWNEANVELLSPLDEARLAELLAWSDLGAVIGHQGVDVGFVLTFAAGSAYDSTNYRWFADRNPAFLYLDRVVVDPAVRRSGVATRVYDAIEARARSRGPVMCLEVNLDPPNEPSLAFHHRRGYLEVGQEEAQGHLVSLLEKQLG